MAKTEESYSQLTLLAIEAALLAGDILRQGYGTQFTIRSKEGTHNLVTEYDQKAEEAILSFLKQHVPHSHFLAEESGESGDQSKGMTWIVDPLDGTVNFAHGIPHFSVSIGVEVQGEVVCGVVHHPIAQELFVAEKGKGAFLNGKPIHVSSAKKLSESILATGFPYNLIENPHHCIEHFVDILRAGIPIRRMGSAALDLAYTASGRFEGFFEVSLSPWDCCAGMLLVEEAGGKLSDWSGRPFDMRSKKPILATNTHIHKDLITLLNRSEP